MPGGGSSLLNLQRSGDDGCMHLQLCQRLGDGVGEGEIVAVHSRERDKTDDRDGEKEQPQDESKDDKSLGLGIHLQAPDEIDGEGGDGNVDDHVEHASYSPASEGRADDTGFAITPWLGEVLSQGDDEDGNDAEDCNETSQAPAELGFVGVGGQAVEEEGYRELSRPEGEEEEDVRPVDDLQRIRLSKTQPTVFPSLDVTYLLDVGHLRRPQLRLRLPKSFVYRMKSDGRLDNGERGRCGANIVVGARQRRQGPADLQSRKGTEHAGDQTQPSDQDHDLTLVIVGDGGAHEEGGRRGIWCGHGEEGVRYEKGF